MASPKISTFIVALIWVSFFAAVSATFIANGATNYGLTYDNSAISSLNKLEELNNETDKYTESITEYKEKSGLLDIVGDIFNQGFKSLKIMAKSTDIFRIMLFDSFNNSGYNIPAMEYLKTAIFLTILILIVVGVIVKAVTKTDV